MAMDLYKRIHQRELGELSPYTQTRGFYGDRRWIKNLDIVNELGGHTGCVNALSWSKSGNLLASGSDDTKLNIHIYQPQDSSAPFALASTIDTGHRANIFSVKFMPHSADRTLISAAGDHEIRIFDLEYASQFGQGHSARNGTIKLTQGEANAKVYRSHSDRVKRIVTESSPFLFLSCSEDGEVRQWDIRQPESAYPRKHTWSRSRDVSSHDDSVPPPLISYKRQALDLNTISCSPSQPHYIAVGGAHLHCFLHDRRMLGRDQTLERGTPPAISYERHIGDATQCVRRFAPNGQARMRGADNGHITACKISDARPNELIVSWSGDHIYAFDMTQPESEDSTQTRERSGSGLSVSSADRKRKRQTRGSILSHEGASRAEPSIRRQSSSMETGRDHQRVTLRVNYQNGQSEDFPINQDGEGGSTRSSVEDPLITADSTSYQIASACFEMRKIMFGPESDDIDLDHYATSLAYAAKTLSSIDDLIRAWRYPVNPDNIDVSLQTKLRQDRQSVRRFVQAVGVLSRLLHQITHELDAHQTLLAEKFPVLSPTPNETRIVDESETFAYDFIRAITAWLDSGVGNLVEQFTQRRGRRDLPRYPVPAAEASEAAVDDYLIPYLGSLASDKPLRSLEASRFETDESQYLFKSEAAAVQTFSSAVQIPFLDLSAPIVTLRGRDEDSDDEMNMFAAQERRAAVMFWARKVARSLLWNASKKLDFGIVDRAFGGSGHSLADIKHDEQDMHTRLAVVTSPFSSDEEDPIESVAIGVDPSASNSHAFSIAEGDDEQVTSADDLRAVLHAEDDTGMADMQDQTPSNIDHEHSNDDDDDEDSNDNDNDDDDNTDQEDDEESSGGSEDDDEGVTSSMWRSAFARSSGRSRVQQGIPCSDHTKVYRGHVNVKTVKDVNYFGLQDEYIVSGSDSGHVFIWDRSTSQLVNIIEGDGEVVNVIQGHPYEPVLAVSGIDYTIKIFSPDRNAQRLARQGVNVSSSVDPETFPSLNLGGRRLRVRRTPSPHVTDGDMNANRPESEPAMERSASSDEDEDVLAVETTGTQGRSLTSRKRMHQEYSITSHNEVERRGGNREAFITRSMLAQLAERMQRRNMGVAGGRAASGDAPEIMGVQQDEQTIVVNEDCTVM